MINQSVHSQDLLKYLAATHGRAKAEADVNRQIVHHQLYALSQDANAWLVPRREYLAHRGILAAVSQRLAQPANVIDHRLLDDVLKNQNFKPDSTQYAAICNMISSPISITFGGAGTGKSSVAISAARYIEQTQPDKTQIVTAQAAKIALTTALRCKLDGATLHSLLGLKPGEENDPHIAAIDASIGTLYIDEAFAITPALLRRILLQAPAKCRLAFLGDPAQLAPIGHGRALHDILEHAGIPAVRLTTSHRLGAESHLTQQAERAAQGQFIQSGSKFEIIVDATRNRAESDRRKAMCAVQLQQRAVQQGLRCIILTPSQYGDCGHIAINQAIARHQTPQVGDDILTTASDAKQRWRNGESGKIVGRTQNTIQIRFANGRLVDTAYNNNQIAFGYAMSIHRCQGLEYDLAIILVAASQARGFSRQALVSAMTRAKTCKIITDPGVLETALKLDDIRPRPNIIDSMLSDPPG